MIALAGEAIGSVRFSGLFDQSFPSFNLSVTVIVPARNEAQNISSTLDALRLQVDEQGHLLAAGTYEVLLLTNNCTDDTVARVRQYHRDYPQFPLLTANLELPQRDAHIGKVRGILMNEACRRFDLIDNHAGIIASTDGDTVVDPQWIYHIMAEINRGADAVGGKILVAESVHSFMDYQKENELYWNLVAYVESLIDPLAHDPWPRHFQYFGANMAVKKSIYQAVGGIPELRYLEDNALHDALFRNDARIRKSPDVLVTTSARTEGRVEVGFSEQLRKWAEMHNDGIPQRVPSGFETIKLLQLRKRLRNCWGEFLVNNEVNEQESMRIASALFIDCCWLEQEIKSNSYFGTLWQKVELVRQQGSWNSIHSPVVISSAIECLQKFEAGT